MDAEEEKRFVAEMLAEEEAFFAMDEDVVYNACYIEYTLEDWPLLTRLTEQEKITLYEAFAQALQLAQSPPQVIGAHGANLHLVVHQCLDLSIDDIERILVGVCAHVVQLHSDAAEPEGVSAQSIGMRCIPEAVTRIGGKIF